MGRASINRLLVRFAGPSIITMLVMGSYNVVDTIFVGRLGPESIAALTVSFPFMMLFVAVGVGTGVGATSLIARYLGSNRRPLANRAAATSFTLCGLFGILVPVICLPNLETIMRLFGATDAVLPLAMDYMTVLVTFAVLNFFPMIVGSVVRAEGNPILPSVAGVISVGANIGLDPVLIFGLGPAPELGIAGAAWATVFARGIAVLILTGYFVLGKTGYRFRPGHFVPRLRTLAEIYRVGSSQVVQMMGQSVVMGFANTIAGGFGVVTLALIGVIMRSASFIFMPCVGLAQGGLPLIGYNFGAGKHLRVGEVIGKEGLLSSVWSLVFFVVVMLFPRWLISIFNTDPEFIRQGVRALRVFALGFPFIGVTLVVGSFFQGIGKGLPSIVLASARHVLFLYPALLILPPAFGVVGLWASFAASSLLAGVLALIWAVIQLRTMGIGLHIRRTSAV